MLGKKAINIDFLIIKKCQYIGCHFPFFLLIQNNVQLKLGRTSTLVVLWLSTSGGNLLKKELPSDYD